MIMRIAAIPIALLSVCLLFVPALLTPLHGQAKNLVKDGKNIVLLSGHRAADHELLVAFTADADRQIRNYVHGQVNGYENYTVLQRFESINLDHVSLSAELSLQDAIDYYKSFPSVRYAEPHFLMKAKLDNSEAQKSGPTEIILRNDNQSDTTTPNDSYFGVQWALDNWGQYIFPETGTTDCDINATQAWDTETGSSFITIGVLDTGADLTHPDLNDNIWANNAEVIGANGVDDDSNGYVDDKYGFDALTYNPPATYNAGTPADDNGHGTMVAGIIGAETNNGQGIAGVAWNVKMMIIKCVDRDGDVWNTNLIEAIEYAGANGADLLTMGWVTGTYSSAVQDAISAYGKLFVTASGDDNYNLDTYGQYPASYNLNNILVVTATTNKDELMANANTGLYTVDMGAPGRQIYSTNWRDESDYGYGWSTGMASAHVAGTAVLVMAEHPYLNHLHVKQWLMDCGSSLADLRGSTVSGNRLSAYLATLGMRNWDLLRPD
jgi:subtilisin family serine protease